MADALLAALDATLALRLAVLERRRQHLAKQKQNTHTMSAPSVKSQQHVIITVLNRSTGLDVPFTDTSNHRVPAYLHLALEAFDVFHDVGHGYWHEGLAVDRGGGGGGAGTGGVGQRGGGRGGGKRLRD